MENKLKIKVIAPASKTEDIVSIIEKLKLKLHNEDIELIFDESIFGNDTLPFFANSKQRRGLDLLESIQAEDYKIIWAARGGYGSGGLIEQCLNIFPSKQKILIGFSDITALHLLFNQHYKMPTIHGPVITSFVKNDDNFNEFRSILSGLPQIYNLRPLFQEYSEEILGEIAGGNLTILTTLIGTKLSPILKDKILLLEDVNEKGYQVHRHLMHLKQSGSLNGVCAIIFGDFSLSDKNLHIAIEDFCRYEIDIPAFYVDSIGHGKINKPIVMGAMSQIVGNTIKVDSPFHM